MTGSEVASLVQAAINAYSYPRPARGLLGEPWTPERIAGELQLLRESLVLPTRRTLLIHQRAPEEVWMVACINRVAVYLDESRGDFGLGGLSPEGHITDWGVYGDLVGTFMAR